MKRVPECFVPFSGFLIILWRPCASLCWELQMTPEMVLTAVFYTAGD